MPPVRPVDGAVRWFHESFRPGEDCRGLELRRLYIPLRPKDRFSPGRKIQPLPSPHRTWPIPDASFQSH